MDLTDQQWTIIEPLFEEKRRPDDRGARGATRVARCAWRDARGAMRVR
jgi:hypothetical protein